MARACLLLAALIQVPSAPAAEEPGGFVKPGQPVSDLRATEAESSPSLPRSARLSRDWSRDSLPLLWLAAATVVSLAVFFILWRRRRKRASAGEDGARLEVLDRIALSSRQWVCILRVDEKRLVVGVSGDALTSLAVLEDDRSPRPPRRPGSGAANQLDVDPERFAEAEGSGRSSGAGRATSGATSPGAVARRDESGFWFRPESPSGEQVPKDSGDDWENHLAPYRREVNRLRAMLQNWRQTTDRGERAETGGGEGKSE